MSAAASPWRHVADVLPLRAWSDAQRNAVGETVARIVRSWEQAWGLPAACGHVRCTPAGAVPGGSCWQLLGTCGAATAWYERLACFDEALAQSLWDSPAVHGPIARGVQASCAQDLLVRFAGELRVEASSVPVLPQSPLADYWSGALLATLPWHVNVLLDAKAVEALLDGAAPTPSEVRPPVPLGDALAARAIPLRVHLADCEMVLGALSDLQVGDVLRLRHPLHTPLQVRDAEGHSLFDASLARRGGFKAAQLAAPTPLTGKALP